MSDNNPQSPNPFKEMLARTRVLHEFKEKIDALSDKSGEALENAVLMNLWADLGDNTETYWQAMTAITAFVGAHKATTDAMSKVGSTRVKARLVRALAEIWKQTAELTEEIVALEDERDRRLASL
jgi:hypothetical protein